MTQELRGAKQVRQTQETVEPIAAPLPSEGAPSEGRLASRSAGACHGLDGIGERGSNGTPKQ